MKTEYSQLYRGDFGTPSLRAVDVSGEDPQFFYGDEVITKEEFIERRGAVWAI